MNTHKKTAIIVGALFLIAMVTSIVGGSLIDSILTAPEYLDSASENETTVIIGVLLELINGLAVVGIAVSMFPLFKKRDEALALGYVALRIIEAVIAIAAIISALTIIELSQEYVSASAADPYSFQILGTSLLAERTLWVSTLLGIIFSLAALVFYYLLYQTILVPRFISIWGLIAVVLIFAWNLLELFGISLSVGMLLALPIILNEIFLGIWLIIKGFNSSATVFEPAQSAIN